MRIADLNTERTLSQLYKEPYCTCTLREIDLVRYRVFEIQDDLIRNKLMEALITSSLRYELFGDRLYIYIPYFTGTSLLVWQDQEYDMIERLQLCEQILFEFMHSSLPELLFTLCIDPGSILVTDDGIKLLQHPSFYRILHESNGRSIYQASAELCYSILEADKVMHKHDYLKNPIEIQDFHRKIIWKRYRNYDMLMKDIMDIKNKMKQPKSSRKKDILIVKVFILITILIVALFIVLKITENQTEKYNGIPEIGKERLIP